MSLLCSKLLCNAGRVLLNHPVSPQNAILTVRCFGSSPKSKKGIFKLGLVGITVGALVGTGYSIRQLNKPNAHILNEQTRIPLLESVPEIKPSRRVSSCKEPIDVYARG